jgi:drug/metabolite transporter (DMT)-like permease
MDWLILTAFSVISRSIYGVMTKVLSNKLETSIHTQAAILPFITKILSFLVSPLIGGINFDLSKVNIVALILVVITQGIGNIIYFEAIKKLTNSTAQIAFSSILIFNTLLALVFFDLHLSFINIIGLFLLMISILSVTTGKIELNKTGILLMVLAAFLFSVFQLASAEVSNQIGTTTYLVITYWGAALIVFVLKAKIIINDFSKLKNIKSSFGIPLLTAIPSLGNFIFAYYAYSSAPEPAKVAMLLTSQVVLTILLSYFFLKEKKRLFINILAAILVVIAAFLIKS